MPAVTLLASEPDHKVIVCNRGSCYKAACGLAHVVHAPGPSYTVDTLRLLGERQPRPELFLILGGDSLNDLPTWYEPLGIIEQATLLIVARPGWEMPPLEGLRQQLHCPDPMPLRIQVVR